MAQENIFGRVPYAFKPEYTEEVENLPADNKSKSNYSNNRGMVFL